VKELYAYTQNTLEQRCFQPVHLLCVHVKRGQYEIQLDRQWEYTAVRLSPLYTYCTTEHSMLTRSFNHYVKSSLQFYDRS